MINKRADLQGLSGHMADLEIAVHSIALEIRVVFDEGRPFHRRLLANSGWRMIARLTHMAAYRVENGQLEYITHTLFRLGSDLKTSCNFSGWRKREGVHGGPEALSGRISVLNTAVD
jgi:hypothetical protein